MKVKEFQQTFNEALENTYDSLELLSLFYIVCEELLGITKMQIRLHPELTIPTNKLELIPSFLNDLVSNKPIQYITNQANFYDRSFYVNEHVLIPRQETEELIALIASFQLPKESKMLDIGTGSGIIPITAYLEFGFENVHAIDISNDAIQVAKKNAEDHHAKVTFIQQNILEESLWDSIEKSYDLIVSNPPYVTNQEKEEMHENVLAFEPHLALFVEDNEPLLFYRAIAELASKKLNPKGILCLEINEKFGQETASLVKSYGFYGVSIKKDINGKDRMVYGFKS